MAGHESLATRIKTLQDKVHNEGLDLACSSLLELMVTEEQTLDYLWAKLEELHPMVTKMDYVVDTSALD